MHSKPVLPEQSKAPVPLSGNFYVRDEFTDTSLAMIYSMIRTPRERWYSLEDSKLLIRARNESIDNMAQPSFIGRRQQHSYCSASTVLQYTLQNPGDKAGMVAFQNEEHYYFTGITLKEDGQAFVLEKGSAEGPVEMVSTTIDIANDAPVYIKIEARGKYYDFYYALEAGKWKLLQNDVDGMLLSTHVAGGFVGTYFGMYAYKSIR
ncbi:Non-reducing end alpha-L-arabinofuranosidase BoGH43B [subsurface metagenome]